MPEPIPRAAAGFVLPTAVFLLVALGGMAVWLMRITETGMAQINLEMESERAWQAAQAGLDAGIYAARAGHCGNQDITFDEQLSRFTASVRCVQTTADEGGVTLTFFSITSTACNEPVDGACPKAEPTLSEYAERQVTAMVEQ